MLVGFFVYFGSCILEYVLVMRFLVSCVYFHLFPLINLQNIFSRNTSGTWLIAYAYVLKCAHFSLFGYKLAVNNVQ